MTKQKYKQIVDLCMHIVILRICRSNFEFLPKKFMLMYTKINFFNLLLIIFIPYHPLSPDEGFFINKTQVLFLF